MESFSYFTIVTSSLCTLAMRVFTLGSYVESLGNGRVWCRGVWDVQILSFHAYLVTM